MTPGVGGRPKHVRPGHPEAMETRADRGHELDLDVPSGKPDDLERIGHAGTIAIARSGRSRNGGR